MPKKIYQCPKCKTGTLEKLNAKEIAKIKESDHFDIYPKVIFGCDECKYWIDEELLKD